MLRTLFAAIVAVPCLLAMACSGYNEVPTTTPPPAGAPSAPPITTQAARPASCPPSSPVPSSIPGVAAAPAGAQVMTTPSGLQYIDLAPGSGPEAKTGQTATVHYTGWLVDGKKFDSSRDRGQPFMFPLGGGQVIKGWDEGVVSMKVGGQRRLIVPPGLGYGTTGAGGTIPPCASLVFDVELLGLK